MPIAPSVSAPFAAATTPLAAATTDAHAAADALSAASLPAAPPPLEVASEDMK